METTPPPDTNASALSGIHPTGVHPSATEEVVLVFTTLPAEVDARAFVQPLLEARLIACGTVLAPASSVYRWDGAVVESAEQQVLLKTTTGTLERLRDAALAHHPYDVPEWLIVPVAGGLPTYLAWVRGETAVP